jgi:transcriptional regulator with XRE-family HTH domain
MDVIADIARKLKEARKAKGLSQRALAKLAGVPQSHISKIETTGVDLRISSLTEIARALDLELTLVPRKNVSAVNSIVRSTQSVAPRQVASIAKELVKLEAVAGKIAQQQKSLKEAVQLQSRVHELTRLELPSSYLDTIEKLNKQLQQVYKEPEALQQLRDSLNQVQFLRNELVHNPGGRVKTEHRARYSLEEDDHG